MKSGSISAAFVFGSNLSAAGLRGCQPGESPKPTVNNDAIRASTPGLQILTALRDARNDRMNLAQTPITGQPGQMDFIGSFFFPAPAPYQISGQSEKDDANGYRRVKSLLLQVYPYGVDDQNRGRKDE